MEMTQIKGVAVTVGATAAFTALLTGSIVTVHNYQETGSNIDTAEAFNDLQVKAADATTNGLTGAFSDHCLTLKESVTSGASPLSWVPEHVESRTDVETGEVFTETTVAYSELADSYDWQWTATSLRSTASTAAHRGITSYHETHSFSRRSWIRAIARSKAPLPRSSHDSQLFKNL